MARLDYRWFDYRLLAAVVAPLLVWPWIPRWQDIQFTDGQVGLLAFFILVPIVEEVIFRGFIQGWLLQRTWFKQITVGLSRANWMTSLIFASVHAWQHPLWLIPGYFLVSLVLGYFRERYRGILVPILLHGYYNAGLFYFS